MDTNTDTDRTLLRDPEAAKELNVVPRTLAEWRRLRKGPPFVRLGSRAVRYRRCDLIAWVDSHLQTPAGAA